MRNVVAAFVFIVSCFIVCPLSAHEGKNEMTLLLPINHVKDKKVNLRVNIDTPYESGGQPKEFMTFILQGENSYTWSEKLTVQTLVGFRQSAAEFLGQLQMALRIAAPSTKILLDHSEDMKTYEMSSFGAVYETGGRKELIYVRYYSGPDDLCGVQYLKELKAGESPEKVLRGLVEYVDKISMVVE
jgi:hypothetical protein